MVNDASSRRTTDKRPIARSTREALSKEAIQSSSTSSTNNRKSELLQKRTPPTLEIGSKSENNKKLKTTPSPLRRSERNRNSSSSPSSNPSPSNSGNAKERNSVKASSKLVIKKLDARAYRKAFKTQNKDYHEESDSLDRSTSENGSRGGGKIDECSKANSSHCKAIPKDVTLPPEDAKGKDMCAESRLRRPEKELLENDATLDSTCNDTTHETSGAPERVQPDLHGKEVPQILASRNSSNENLIRKCAGHDNMENMTSPKRKSTLVDKCSDISATLVDDDNSNVIVDAGPSRLCCNIVETSGPCSKRIRGVSLSGEQKDQRKFINDVDQPCSKSNDENSSARENEERPQANNVETEKIRKQQRSLHLSLKPEIAKLCEILLLPDNVKSMVQNFLEYTMNNYQICTEPISILQAFQLSLCWTIASMLRHKLDFGASLMLAKQHLNFDCKKDVVNEIKAKLWDLKDEFLLLTGNSEVIGSPKASETSDTVYSNTEVIEKIELTEKDITKNIKETQKRKSQWRRLLQMQQDHKRRLEKQFETEKADFGRRCNLELAFIRSGSSNDVTRTEKLKDFQIECGKQNRELERQHEVLLKDLEAKQLEARRKLQESWALDESLNLVSSNEFGTPDNAPIILLPNAEVAPAVHKTISSNDDSSRQRKLDGTILSEPVSTLSTKAKANGFIDVVQNMASSNSQSPEECMPSVSTMCKLYCKDAAQIHETDDRNASNDGNGSNNVVTLKLPLNHGRSGDGNVLDRDSEMHVEIPTTANITPLSMQPLSPVESPPSPADILPANETNHISMVMQPPEQVQQLPSSGLLSSNRDLSDLNLVTRTEDRAATNEDALSQIPEASIEVYVEMPSTANITPLSMQPLSPVESPPSPADSLPANQTNHVSMVIEPPELVQQSPSSGLLSSNKDLSNEDQAATNEAALISQIPEASTEVQNQTVERPQPPPSLEVDSHSHVVPPEQVHQLPSSGLLSINQNLSNLHLVAGVEYQAIDQPPSSLDVDSVSCRVVVPPASNIDLDSFMPGGVRAQFSDTRSLSFPRVINNHPIQTAAQSTSRMVPSLCHDPLSHELEKIRKRTEQHMKNHEDMKLQMKCDFEKEFEELRRKYEIKFKELEGEFLEARKNQDTTLKFVYAHKILADALMAKYPKVMQQDAGSPQLSYQLPRQQSASRPSLVATSSPRGPPAPSFQNSYATTGSATPSLRGPPAASLRPVVRPPLHEPPAASLQTLVRPPPMQAATGSQTVIRPPPVQATAGSQTVMQPQPTQATTGSQTVGRPPPMQATYNTSGIFSSVSGVSARRPHINSTSPPSGNLQAGGEIRAPAPHLQPYRTPTSVPASSTYTAPNGMPSHIAHGNIPASSLPFSQPPPRPMRTISQSDTHGGQWHENRGGLSTPNMSAVDLRADANSQSSINLPNALPRMPDLASLNPSISGQSSIPANSDQAAAPPDVVCLSDDE